jgi:hypothetical protein
VPHYRGTALRLPPRAAAPDASDLASVRRWVNEASGPTAIDLFCGAGGLSLGLREAAYKDLNAVIDEVGELLKKYSSLLTATIVGALTPVHQQEWRAAFRVAWWKE